MIRTQKHIELILINCLQTIFVGNTNPAEIFNFRCGSK